MGGVRTGRRQAAKVVLSEESRRRAVQRADVERSRLTQDPLIRFAKWRRRGVVRSEQVAIAPCRCAAARVKPGPHPVYLLHPDPIRQQRIDRATQLRRAPAILCRKTDCLSECMNTGVGAARARGDGTATHELLQHRLELSLNRAVLRLPLPSGESAPIVLDNSQEGPGRPTRHGGKMQLVVTI